MSALACLAEHPGAIQKIFLTKSWSFSGKYAVRLYRATTGKWETLLVDDWFPVSASTGVPLFARPQGPELWVMLLEKAFAKFMGKPPQYGALDGGFVLYALQAMTGDRVFQLRRNPAPSTPARPAGTWRVLHVAPHDPRDGTSFAFSSAAGAAPLSTYAFFGLLLRLDRRRACVSAAIDSTAGEDRTSYKDIGLVAGHAYSILEAAEVEGIRLLRLRNPWGTFEWKARARDRRGYGTGPSRLGIKSASEEGKRV